MSDRYETDREQGGTGPYDHSGPDDSVEDRRSVASDHLDHLDDPDHPDHPDDIDEARENVLDGWPVRPEDEEAAPDLDAGREPAVDARPADPEPVEAVEAEPDEDEPVEDVPASSETDVAAPVAAAAAASVVAPEVETPERPEEPAEESAEAPAEHAPAEVAVPPGYAVLEGEPSGARRAVGVVVSRFNGDVTTRLLESALAELEEKGVDRDAITVMPVPGAFELPLAAMALAKTRRFSCVVALGCVIRGDTPHFGYVAGEAASGLQLAALETGVPVAFGLLTLENAEQAEPRVDKGAEAVRTALEMADVLANLRTAAAQ